MVLNLSANTNITKGSITIAEDYWFMDATTFQFIFGIFLIYLLLLFIKLWKSGFFQCRSLHRFNLCLKRRENYAEQEYKVLCVKM